MLGDTRPFSIWLRCGWLTPLISARVSIVSPARRLAARSERPRVGPMFSSPDLPDIWATAPFDRRTMSYVRLQWKTAPMLASVSAAHQYRALKLDARTARQRVHPDGRPGRERIGAEQLLSQLRRTIEHTGETGHDGDRLNVAGDAQEPVYPV